MTSDDDRVVEAFLHRAQRGLAIMSSDQLKQGWQLLQEANACFPRPRRRSNHRALILRLGFLVAVVGIAVTIIVYGFSRWWQGEPLRYTVEGQAASPDNTVTASVNASSRLLFSDASSIELSANTRVTVDALAARAPHLTVVDGSIQVLVKPRPHAAWTFAAGPFHVRVKETAFNLAYAVQTGRMSLRVLNGSVELQGSQGRDIVLSAGEALHLHAEGRAASDLDDSPDSSVSDEILPSGGPPVEPTPATARTSTRPAPSAKEGQSEKTVAAAETRGLETVVARASLTELSSLAEEASRTKHDETARHLLLAIRARFPNTEPARNASFFLGRLCESVPGQPEAALGWYETYLREAPRGLYASEAMGREMTLSAPADRRRASLTAKDYLERFPNGSQAGLARSLLQVGDR